MLLANLIKIGTRLNSNIGRLSNQVDALKIIAIKQAIAEDEEQFQKGLLDLSEDAYGLLKSHCKKNLQHLCKFFDEEYEDLDKTEYP